MTKAAFCVLIVKANVLRILMFLGVCVLTVLAAKDGSLSRYTGLALIRLAMVCFAGLVFAGFISAASTFVLPEDGLEEQEASLRRHVFQHNLSLAGGVKAFKQGLMFADIATVIMAALAVISYVTCRHG